MGRSRSSSERTRLCWYDARTLTEIGTPAKQTVSSLWDSPDGRLLACAAPDGAGVDVFLDPYLATLAGRALDDIMPADLTAVTEALHATTPVGPPRALPFLVMLRDYLELRFGSGPALETGEVQ